MPILRRSGRRMIWQAIGLLVAVCFAPACSYTIRAAASQAATASESRVVRLHVQRVKPFIDCLAAEGGTCTGIRANFDGSAAPSFFSETLSGVEKYSPTVLDTHTPRPRFDAAASATDKGNEAAVLRAKTTVAIANFAREVLNSDFQKKINALFSLSQGALPSEVKEQVDGKDVTTFSVAEEKGGLKASVIFPLDQIKDYAEKVETSVFLGAWDALDDEASLVDSGTDAGDRRRRRYIKTYLDAYFRDGKFFKVSVSKAELRTRVLERLKRTLPGLEDAQYESTMTSLFGSLGDVQEFGKISDEGFITRAGKTFAFPGVEASVVLGQSNITVTKVDYVAVGSDLIRVLLHAIFDANNRLPAVSSATGTSGTLHDHLRVFDPEEQDMNVSDDEFGRIESRATQVEAAVSAGVGRLVRGASWYSLNNEALATAIETAVGVTFHKATEKALWCWYQCDFDSQATLSDYLATGTGQEIELTVKIEGLLSPSAAITGEATRD